jgi:hypothetical protein
MEYRLMDSTRREGRIKKHLPSGCEKNILPDAFTIGAFVIVLKLTDEAQLPPHKGEFFHRLLGSALDKATPVAGKWFYHPRKPTTWPDDSQTPPKPYFLRSPLDSQTRYAAGEQIELGITLFGVTRQLHVIVVAALEKLGRSRGLNGKGRGCFQVSRVLQLVNNDKYALYESGNWLGSPREFSAADVFGVAPASASTLKLELKTPLQITSNGALVTKAPTLSVILERILGRVNTLAAMYCGGVMLPPEEKTALLALARAAVLKTADTRWASCSNEPKRGFKGLAGSMEYNNVPAALLPWLALGQWIGVGAKTSFGMGLYSMEVQECTK